MYLRCPECFSAVWADGLERLQANGRFTCTECGRSRAVQPLRGLGSSLAEHFQKTLRYSQERGTDMPTSYALLLGLLSERELAGRRGTPPVPPAFEPAARAGPSADRRGPPDAARASETADPVPSMTNGPGSCAARATAVAEPPPAPSGADRGEILAHLDPAFQPAIDAGLLSPRAAIERGDREVFAMRLVRRHRLAPGLAFDVADNRLPLGEALRLNERPLVSAPARRHASLGSVILLIVAAATGLAAYGWQQWNRTFGRLPTADAARTRGPATTPAGGAAATPASEPVPAPETAPTVDIRHDAEGRIVEIAAPDPAGVLVAYCAAQAPTASLEPLEITETLPRLGMARLGVFRDADLPQATRAIWMRRDWRTGRWVAGDGLGPIPVREAPELPEGAFRRPVGPPTRPG